MHLLAEARFTSQGRSGTGWWRGYFGRTRQSNSEIRRGHIILEKMCGFDQQVRYS